MNTKDSLINLIKNINSGTREFNVYSDKIINILQNDINKSLTKYILDELIKEDWTDQKKYKYFGESYVCEYELSKSFESENITDTITIYRNKNTNAISIYIKPLKEINIEEFSSYSINKKSEKIGISAFNNAILYINNELKKPKTFGDCIRETNIIIKEHNEYTLEYIEKEEELIQKKLFDVYVSNKRIWTTMIKEYENDLALLTKILVKKENLSKAPNIKIILN